MDQSRQPENTAPKRETQKGAVIIEATLTLTFFMFAIFTLLSVTQIAYVQSRMSTALSCATKELAEYAHVYYVTQLDKALPSSGGKSSEVFNKVGDFLQNIGSNLGTIDDELGKFVTETGNSISGDSLGQWIKSGIGEGIIKKLMLSNLVSGTGESPEEFLRANRVENVSLSQSSFLEDDSRDIFMQVTYDIRVLKLLHIDYTFHMSTWAYATAWGN